MGQVIVKNPDTVNGDLVTLENFIQAILFYDDLICIDNYKEKYKEARKAAFNFVKFISPNDFRELEQIEKKAKSEAESIHPEIRGGKFVDNDFRELLERLKMNMVCTWDIRSSVYYLTMKMLGQPNTPEFQKYSELSAAIFNELSDVGDTIGYWSKDVCLIGSDSILYTKEKMQERGFGGTTRALDMFVTSLNWLAYKTIYYSLTANDMFVTSLNWLAYKTIYYSLTAKYLKADTFLHPIRHAFQIHWMKKTGAYGHDFTAKLIQSLSEHISTSVSQIIDNGRSSVTSIELPIFSAWLGVESGNINTIISSALELKRQQKFRDIRGLLREIRNVYDENGITNTTNKLVNKWEKELSKASANLKKDYGLKTAQGIQVSNFTKVYNSAALSVGWLKLPELDFRISLPSFMQNNVSQSFSNLYKDIGNELTAIDRLGGVRDILASQFQINYERYIPPKTEAPEFRYCSSDWKIPM
jgi:hypothetical protein